MKRILFFTILLCLSASLVVGQSFTGAGSDTGGIITSGAPSTDIATVALPATDIAGITCLSGDVIADVPVPATLGVNYEVVSVEITDLTHTWVGDVDIQIITPAGTVVDMVGTGPCGSDDYNLGTYTFVPGSAMGPVSGNCANAPDGINVAPGEYAPEGTFPVGTAPACNMDPGVTPPTGEAIDGAWTLLITDNVGGDDGTYTDFTITFAPIAFDFDVAACCPVVCELVGCDDQTIPLEPGECQELAFFDVQLGSSCGEIEIFTTPDGVATSTGNSTATDNLDGSVDFVSMPGNGNGGDVANYTWTTPACAAGNVAVSFDWEYDAPSGSFWDEFTIDGPNGNIVSESGSFAATANAGSVCEAVAPGSVWEIELSNIAFGTGGGTAAMSAYQAVCGSGFILSQTSGIESGIFLAEGCYPITYSALPVTFDPVTCDLVEDPANSVDCEFEICVEAYSGTVTEALACNDHVNISLDENCEVVLSSDMFLEGGPYACFDDYPVSILAFGAGDPIDIEPGVPISLPCGDHTAMVTSPLGNTCWGTFTIEDKIVPTFEVGALSVTCVEDVPVILANGGTFSEPIVLVAEDLTAPTDILEVGVYDYCFDLSATPACPELLDINIDIQALHWGNTTMSLTSPAGTTIVFWDPGANGFWSCPTFGTMIMDLTVDDDSPNLPLTCADFQGGGMWNTISLGGTTGTLADFEGEDPTGEWCVTFDVGTAFGGDPTELYGLTIMANDLNSDCDGSPQFPVPDASECECQSYSFADVTTTSDCGDGTIERTWICTDKAGNQSDPVVQTITVSPLGLDQLGDTWFVPPALIELPCGTGTDPWDIADYYDNWIDVDGDGVLDMLSDITNDCDNSDPDCPAVYEFEEGVVMGFPYYQAWGCNSGCNAKNVEHPQPIDNNVCNLFVTYSDQDIAACGDECPGNVKVIRTWTVLDWCTSETIPYVQIIKSTDNEDPEITAPNITLSVNPWGCVASGPLPAPEHLFDGCAKDLTYTVSGPAGVSIFSIAGDGTAPYGLTGAPKGEHEFIYTAVDCCGNVGTSTMTVTVVDDTPPTAIALENIVVSLTSGGFDEGGTAKLYPEHADNGSHDGDCGPVGLEIRRPAGAPICGNVGLNGYNNNETFNNNGDPEDNSSDTDGGQYIKFCCDDLEGGDTYTGPNGQLVTYNDSMVVVLRVWDDGNCDGIIGNDGDNFNETWTYVRVENKLPPVIVCPPDAEIGCNMDWSLHLDGPAVATAQELAMLSAPDFGTGVATGAGVCGAVSITYEDRYNEDVCYDRNGEIRREWCIDGTDICCTQDIDIVKVGAFDPNTISWNSGFPEAEIFEDCIYDHTDQEPSWLEAPCDLIAWTVSSDTFYIEGNAAQFGCIKVINDYTVVDWCADEEYTFTQVIKVIDEEAPTLVFNPICVPVIDGCSAAVQLCANATDMGECESPWLKWEVLVDLYGDWSYDHVFSSYVSPLDPNFGTGPNEYYIPASAPGDDVCIDLPGLVPSSKYDHRVIWKVSDGCGNFTSVTEVFQVVDKKAPTPYCLSVSSALMTDGSVELWACDFVIGGEDNCTQIDWMRYTFTGPDADGNFPDVVLGDTNCEARTFTCDDISSTSNVVMVDVYSWDECDNYAVCSVELTLTPEGCDFGDDEGSNRIAGAVATEFGEVLEDVNVSIVSNQPEYPMSIMTDANGEYASADHISTMDYEVSAYNNDDHRNGVSTLDILLIQRHILNLQSLTSPYQYIAADANDDGAITAADLVDIRKLVLEIYDEFPSNTSWRFVDAAQALTTSNAFAFNEVIDILALSADMNNENFVATKTGDVNNSVVLSATGNDAEARNGNLSMNLTGVATSEGVSVEVTSSNFRAIAGYQFTMNTNGMELASVEAGAINMTDDNVAVLDANTVTVSWNTTAPVTVTDEVLFTLNFVGNDVATVADMDITSEVTVAEAYDADLSVLNIVLGDQAAAEFALEQNEPNPFSTQTTVEFSLPTAGTATLTVLDVTGKMVKQITGTYAKGANSIVLTKAELATSGVLYYQLESGDFSATKKMIIIE